CISLFWERKQQMGKTFFLALMLVLVAGCSNSQKVNYELQEKCGKAAAKYFADNYTITVSRYENHYNVKLNKCFIKVIFPSYAHTDNFHLIDLNENKMLGDYFIWPGISETKVAC